MPCSYPIGQSHTAVVTIVKFFFNFPSINRASQLIKALTTPHNLDYNLNNRVFGRPHAKYILVKVK